MCYDPCLIMKAQPGMTLAPISLPTISRRQYKAATNDVKNEGASGDVYENKGARKIAR